MRSRIPLTATATSPISSRLPRLDRRRSRRRPRGQVALGDRVERRRAGRSHRGRAGWPAGERSGRAAARRRGRSRGTGRRRTAIRTRRGQPRCGAPRRSCRCAPREASSAGGRRFRRSALDRAVQRGRVDLPDVAVAHERGETAGGLGRAGGGRGRRPDVVLERGVGGLGERGLQARHARARGAQTAPWVTARSIRWSSARSPSPRRGPPGRTHGAPGEDARDLGHERVHHVEGVQVRIEDQVRRVAGLDDQRGGAGGQRAERLRAGGDAVRQVAERRLDRAAQLAPLVLHGQLGAVGLTASSTFATASSTAATRASTSTSSLPAAARTASARATARLPSSSPTGSITRIPTRSLALNAICVCWTWR